ncbi:D-2-hydroxyacid dehydrogenase, partial [Dietzia sp. DQ12-76]|nr:D-2-hydroxyacid dehydrogenase [Dietzia sp. DQ12-76]
MTQHHRGPATRPTVVLLTADGVAPPAHLDEFRGLVEVR